MYENNVFIKPLKYNNNNSNLKIGKVNDFYDWVREVLAEGVRAGKWYNSHSLIGLAGYINDKNSRMIGYATLRQLRMKNGNFMPV
jgi:polycystin 1L2